MPERAAFPLVPVLILLVVAAGAVGGWEAYKAHQKEQERLAAAIHLAEASPGVAGAQAANSNAMPVQGTAETAPTRPSTSASPTASAPTGKDVSATQIKTAATQTPASKLQGAAPAGGEFEVTIRPKDRAWVSVKSDGKYVVRGIIKPPDVKTIRASGEVVFYTGNAGEVEVAFNGKSVPLTGGINQEETVVFGSKGVQPRAAAQ
jgi:cytoskeletal protein RodZ